MVTVYITNYNYAKYIQSSIESVLNQDFQDFELFIIDDGSTDNSKDIIEAFRENPKITIIYQKNKGLNITNNIALRLASGKYIMRLDADDYLEPNALSSMVDILEERDDIGLVFPDYYTVDPDGNRLEHIKRHNFDTEVSLYNMPAHGACTMIRVEYLRNLGGYNENYTCQDGYELWIKFISKYKVTNVSVPLFSYRRHSSNLTNNESKILDTRAKIHQEHVEKKFKNLDTVAIIPVRQDGKSNKLALTDFGDQKIIDLRIQSSLESAYIKKVIVSSPDLSIQNYIHQRYGDNENVIFHRRDNELARLNDDLNKSIDSVISDNQDIFNGVKAITVLYFEYPLVKAETLSDAINALFLFDSDSLISVREDNRMLFQHDGNGLHPILDHERFTKLERETVYKFSGGTTVIKYDSWKTSKKLLSGRIGHIHINNKEALHIGSILELGLSSEVVSSSLHI